MDMTQLIVNRGYSLSQARTVAKGMSLTARVAIENALARDDGTHRRLITEQVQNAFPCRRTAVLSEE